MSTTSPRHVSPAIEEVRALQAAAKHTHGPLPVLTLHGRISDSDSRLMLVNDSADIHVIVAAGDADLEEAYATAIRSIPTLRADNARLVEALRNADNAMRSAWPRCTDEGIRNVLAAASDTARALLRELGE